MRAAPRTSLISTLVLLHPLTLCGGSVPSVPPWFAVNEPYDPR